MQHQRPQRRIIRIRQIVDILMQRISPLILVLDPRRLDKPIIPDLREQRIRKIAEELLEQGRDGVDIVHEGRGVAEVDLRGVVVKLGFKGVDVRGCARKAVDALNVQAEGVDGKDALDYYHGHSGLVAFEQFLEAYAEDGTERWEAVGGLVGVAAGCWSC